MRHTISVLVENKFGVLARVAGLFSGRGFNIDSLAVAETHDPSISRMTIVVRGDDRILEQINKQLNKLIDVIKVQDFLGEQPVEREIALIKIPISPKTRPEILSIVDMFNAKIADASAKHVVIEIMGSQDTIYSLINMLKPYGIKEMVKSGKIAMGKGL